MANKVNNDDMLQRMKSLMTYGINESKQPAYSSIEYSKVGADGKLYGIVREGTKFYIKEAKDAKGSLVGDNFDYIGGFRNRKANCFESFAAASRYFDEKMINLNESLDKAQEATIAETYINEKNEVIAEQTEKMQKEIARQRQIMQNVQNINESKACSCEPVVGKGVDKNSKSPKCDAKDCEEEIKDYNGKPIKAKGGNLFTEPAKTAKNESKEAKKALNEGETPLCSRENPDYMDTTHGTEIGSSAPFEEPEVVEEEEGAVEGDQNNPTPGTGEVGDSAPFEEKVNESVDDLDDDLEDGDVEDDDIYDDTDSLEDNDVPVEEPVEDEPVDDAEAAIEADVDTDTDTTNARIDALEDKLDKILDAINNIKYDEDDELYDDETEDGDDTDVEEPVDEPTEEPAEDDEPIVKESRSFKAMKARMMNEDKLNAFGQHPAYQKEPMTTPATEEGDGEGKYDMNDASAKGKTPYGTKKGNSAPFTINREKLENEIVENIMRKLKKKLN